MTLLQEAIKGVGCFPSHYVSHKIYRHKTELRNKEARKRLTKIHYSYLRIKALTPLQIDPKARPKLCFLKQFCYFSQPPLLLSLDNNRNLQESNQPRYKAYI